ncbi:hypothetical protein [Archangium lipolyticum]|uniref:hypothetical protein n=1 Tax=Archangium lipolyticum TaxID=2970465 RepID=UPI00214A1E12|nr:hypothetical protein [Archangium lipolyticum]
MRTHVIVIMGLLFVAPLSRAAVPPPEQAVEQLLHASHGINELSGKEILETWEEVRRNPKPYLPFLRARLTLESIEAAKEPERLRDILGATGLLLRLGGNEEREYLAARLKELHRKRDELSAQVKVRAHSLGASIARDDESFRTQVWHRGRLIQVENAILRGFAEERDSRLRDTLLPRLEQDADMRDRYIEYFEVTARQDPVVRARLKKMLAAPGSPVTEKRLRRFFEAN